MSKLEISPEIFDARQKLSSQLESGEVLDKTLRIVVDFSVATLPGCDSAGVTMRIQGRHTTAAASDEFTLEIDRIQYDLSEGPCLEALESGRTVRVDSFAEETRWPEFRRQTGDTTLRSAMSHPLRDDGSVGALNLYSTREQAFDVTSLGISEIFARQATIALRNAATYTASRRLSDELNEALLSRDLIGQAKGILMQREGISDEEAFGRNAQHCLADRERETSRHRAADCGPAPKAALTTPFRLCSAPHQLPALGARLPSLQSSIRGLALVKAGGSPMPAVRPE